MRTIAVVAALPMICALPAAAAPIFSDSLAVLGTGLLGLGLLRRRRPRWPL